MTATLHNRQIVKYLEETKFSAGLFDTLKVKYRTYICPFADLIGLIQPGDRVGDVGCGSGQFLLLAQQFAKPSRVFGIEITIRLIENAHQLFKAKTSIPNKFEVYDGIHFPEELASMDITFLIDVLHHVPRSAREQFIRNLSSRISSGSKLVLKDIDAASPFVLFNKMHDLIFASGERGNEISVNNAINLLESNGFEIISKSKRRMYVYPHYTLVARKK